MARTKETYRQLRSTIKTEEVIDLTYDDSENENEKENKNENESTPLEPVPIPKKHTSKTRKNKTPEEMQEYKLLYSHYGDGMENTIPESRLEEVLNVSKPDLVYSICPLFWETTERQYVNSSMFHNAIPITNVYDRICIEDIIYRAKRNSLKRKRSMKRKYYILPSGKCNV